MEILGESVLVEPVGLGVWAPDPPPGWIAQGHVSWLCSWAAGLRRSLWEIPGLSPSSSPGTVSLAVSLVGPC
jgi:hypothetical protein